MYKKSLQGYTDYPIPELGDTLDTPSPYRPCTLVSYDYDKYVMIVVKGHVREVKRGYVYKRRPPWKQLPWNDLWPSNIKSLVRFNRHYIFSRRALSALPYTYDIVDTIRKETDAQMKALGLQCLK